MYKILKSLIAKKYYGTKAEAAEKADTFYAFGKISDEEYAELTGMINTNYGE